MHRLPQTLLHLLYSGSLMLLPRIGFCQPVVAGPDQPIDAQTRMVVIQSLLQQLGSQYVFPKVATQIQEVIQAKLNAGDYDSITSSKAFADTLTVQIQRISHDKHLQLFYQNKSASSASSDLTAKADGNTTLEQYGRQINFGFGKPELLPGNIGYLRIDEFMPVELAAQTATAALTHLNQTDALILDLRHNRGGEPAMVAFLASYFFGSDSVHLNDIVSRGGKSVQSFWTHSQLPGKRYVGKWVYILTSKKTFSAGEEFAYDLQNLKRATLIGESTAGGAHSGEMVRIGDHFSAFIPAEYALNPITHTNWEGTGVRPDLAIAEHKALKRAQIIALETLISSTDEARKRRKLTRLIKELKTVD
ncbi:S41 family peptidase [Spirosoma foliorum]|uniref:S41 family peptidase n=1 Tax=Spirosoma foliorum TaxID=2710596 RepID=A0A7G5H1L1_9BACT|nr:S41 family peptidase [Spirosoma foliorum]QMW05003.1 S41 family peptidase [Spirosoma foliorum]